MVQLQLTALSLASSNLAVTSVVLGGTLCSLVLYFCCVGRDIMQPCLVLLLCWEGHYAALSCTSVVLGGTLCSLVLYFCCVGRDIMQPCLALLLCWEGHYAALSCTSLSSKYKLLVVSVLLQYYIAIRRFEETTIYRNVGIRISSDAVPYPKEHASQSHQYKNFNNSQI